MCFCECECVSSVEKVPHYDGDFKQLLIEGTCMCDMYMYSSIHVTAMVMILLQGDRYVPQSLLAEDDDHRGTGTQSTGITEG